MKKKIQPATTHPWLVRVIDMGFDKLNKKEVLCEFAFEDKLSAEYVGIELQNRLSNVEGSVQTDIIDRKDNEVWETFSFYNSSKNKTITDIENGSFKIPENLDENEMLWLISNPTESLIKHRQEKAKALKKIENKKKSNIKTR